jgi:endonuclease-3 related protein
MQPKSAAHAETILDPSSAARSLREVYEHLLRAYGPQRWWPARTPFEVIVGAYLVQNTSWRGVVRSIANIDERGLLHVDGLRGIALEELQILIRPSGYMIRKASALKAFITFLDAHHTGSLESLAAQPTGSLRVQLLALPGVGPETADAILLYALGQPVMVVDEYLRRSSSADAGKGQLCIAATARHECVCERSSRDSEAALQ